MIVLAVLAAAALVGAWLIDRRRGVYADLGTTPAAAVSAGRNEVKGRAWHADPLRSHLTGTPCVWWTFRLEEERRHTRTVTSTDAQGRSTTRTETFTQWHDVNRRGAALASFDLVDESGSVRVVPERASVTARRTVHEVFTAEDDRGFLGRLFSLDDRTGRYQRTEELIALGDQLYVVGEASLHEDVWEPALDHGSPFIVSTRSEESHRRRLALLVPLLVLVALAGAAVAGQLAVPGGLGVALGVGAVGLLVLAAATVIVYNRLQLLAEQAARSWSLIDVQLRRRHDLIPQLAAVARGAGDHERAVQEAAQVTRSGHAGLGTGVTAPDDAAIERAGRDAAAQTRQLSALLATIEASPELRADAAFAQLRHALADAEHRIAAARAFYNTTVTLLHDRRGTFPGLLVARFSAAGRSVTLDADGFERTVAPPVHDF